MNNIIIIDLEATCWDGPVPAGQKNEIIEIGICMLDPTTGNITKNQGILVKPQRSEVSSFCTSLTTITPEMLDNHGVSLMQACEIIRNDYQGHQYTWASYGQYDLNMMKKECKAKSVSYPLSADHINVKELFTKQAELKKNVGMKQALDILSIPLEGTHHRGIDDAKNIAKILNWCLNV